MPFSDNSIVLLLSWYIVVASTCCPCAATKFLVHSTCPIASSTATNSASVELLVFSFCFHKAVYVAPFLSVIYIPIWLLMSGCTVFELSNHHFGSSPGLIVSVSDFMFLKYLGLLLLCIEMPLLFVCLVWYVCLNIVILPTR